MFIDVRRQIEEIWCSMATHPVMRLQESPIADSVRL